MNSDQRTLDLIAALLESGARVYGSPLAVAALGGPDRDPIPPGRGMPPGSYLSHWSGAFYLDGLDHFVKRELKIRAYQRYMDDLTLFDDDAGILEDAREAIRDWLWRKRHLRLKRRRDGVQPTAQPGSYLGFRVSRSGVLPGPKAKRRLKRRLREPPEVAELTRCLRSYRGIRGLGSRAERASS